MAFPDEKALIDAAKAGDLSAFNALVLGYQDQAYNVAFRLLNNAESAADAVQESFFKVYRRIDQYRGGSFRAWLLRIVTNTCYDTMRARKRQYASPLDSETVAPEHDRRLSDLRSSPHDHAVRHELNTLLARTIMQLPPGQRTVLVMCDVEGFEYHEVADMTGLALGTVKSRLNRARTKVRGVLAQKGFAPSVPSQRGQVASPALMGVAQF